MTPEKIIEFQQKLLQWYTENARILPWREEPSPYRVWISEIMLQQTRVETVKPYFERFIKEIPTIEDLAKLPEDRLLKLWEGLGYYSRAKNLKKAAQMIVEKFHGQLPSDSKSLQSLPGIGPYTSGAISSIAFGQRTPAIDGNVIRVMARILAEERNVDDPKVKKNIENALERLLPEHSVGDFNQALMELGATLCIPKGMPKCLQCPVNSFCKGYYQDMAQYLPRKSPKKKRKIEQKTIEVMQWEDKFALRKRPEEGLLSNLWEFPQREGHLSLEQCKKEMKKHNIEVRRIISLPPSKHIFSHIEWHMIGYHILLEECPKNIELTWVTPEEIREKYSLPSAFKAYYAFIELISGE